MLFTMCIPFGVCLKRNVVGVWIESLPGIDVITKLP